MLDTFPYLLPLATDPFGLLMISLTRCLLHATVNSQGTDKRLKRRSAVLRAETM